MPLAVVVALPVRPPAQPRLGEDLLVDLPRLAQRDLRLEMINLPTPLLGHAAQEDVFPIGTHVAPACPPTSKAKGPIVESPPNRCNHPIASPRSLLKKA